MSNSDSKVVQTELSPEEYEQLRQVASREEKSLKAALREAANEYAASRSRPDPDDPFFSYEPSDEGGDPVSAERTDEYLYDG